MKLTVGTPFSGLIVDEDAGIEKLSLIAIPSDVGISLEMSSPLLNDKPGSFSYPFPVPAAPNQIALGRPGDFNSIFPLPRQPYILEDAGIQILKGIIEYDTIDKKEIGLILKSGLTEFYSFLDGKKLSELDFGSEWWFPNAESSKDLLGLKLSNWDTANNTALAPYVVAPAIMNNADGSGTIRINKWLRTEGTRGTLVNWLDSLIEEKTGYYQLQFKAWYLLEKIFEFVGFTIVSNQLKESEFEPLVLFSKPIFLAINVNGDNSLAIQPSHDFLHYSLLMPDMDVLEFIDNVKLLMGLVYDINDSEKKVSITFNKTVFLAQSIDTMDIQELAGYQHSEPNLWWTGYNYCLKYGDQQDDNATRADYVLSANIMTNLFADRLASLPTPTIEGYIVGIIAPERDFITVKLGDELVWEQIGRLKPITSGNGKEVVEIPVKVPPMVLSSLVERPKLDIAPGNSTSIYYVDISEMIVSLYHGLVAFDTITVPYLCGDQYSMDKNMNPAETSLFTWAIKDNGISLSPQYLLDHLYKDFLEWKTSTFSTKPFTKYISLTLPQVISLQWCKRYNISGRLVILDKINFDLPFTGIVKVEGYTA